MFRNPRENAARGSGDLLRPSTGRPPSPQSSSAIQQTSQRSEATPSVRTSARKMAAKISTPARKASLPKPKSAQPKNGNIMSFFKKADRSGDPLFVDGAKYGDTGEATDDMNDSDYAEDLYMSNGLHEDGHEESQDRYNELEGPSKRRRTSASPTEMKDAEAQYAPNANGAGAKACSPPPPDFNDETNQMQTANEVEAQQSESQAARRIGPFMEDSNSEEEELSPERVAEDDVAVEDKEANEVPGPRDAEEPQVGEPRHDPPPLRRNSTSFQEQDAFADFDGMEDFEDEYPEGDENAERRWQMKQRRLEMQEEGLEGDFDDDELDLASIKEEPQDSLGLPDEAAPTCPICSANFEGVSGQDASVHVNNCLDGNPTPLPTEKFQIKKEDSATTPPSRPSTPAMKFRRPVRPPKPGQENPFHLGEAKGTGSAFSRLMSGHTEESAWADAAAAEHAARGRPAYERTCPFYKILPGFNICVDAFRYGAVEGCKAYFLSHFHSDHYIGLTSSWRHGPIYCSRPTANLVKQQLRVDPQWVVALEFEKKVEVPGSNGIHVTMIPANHCPGSSLYLFEKVIGKVIVNGKAPKVQRVLHCGDFRACPAHVEHPLLKPDVVDSITGKTAQQKIDVCYLDTTYLNPKYAFPSQEDVIQACADMCVSLNKTKIDKSDEFEKMKAERAGGSMAKFVRQPSKNESATTIPAPTTDTAIIKDEDPDTKHPLQIAKANDIAKHAEAKSRGPLLVIVGTYSIGKERICLGIARALNSSIYAPPGKQRICAALEDQELLSRLTTDPRAAQVHMTPLFEIRAETLGDYLTDYSDRFSRIVGFRPSGWNYRPPGSRFTDSPAVSTVLYSDNWKSGYSMRDLVPQRGSNSRAATYGVPYSEHSSFRELTMFCCALRIDKVVPTVNVGSAKSREKMKLWVERWNTWKKKEGLFDPGRSRVTENGVVLGVRVKKEVGADEEKGEGSHWYPARGTWELRTTL